MPTQPESVQPLVSILTPSFNQGRFLGHCLQSVDRQTYPNIEHVVCDGGSTDETLDVLRGAPDGVAWVSEPDDGQSNAINKALSLSRGEILGWLNSDDAYFDPEAVQTVVEVFEARPEVDVVYGHAALVNGSGLVLHLMWAPRFSYRLLRLFNFVVQPTAFVRRSALGDHLVDETFQFSMDRELWLRLGARGRFARVDRIVAIDRHHPARKVYSGASRMETENEDLDRRYAYLRGASLGVFRRLFKWWGRVVGMRLVRQAQAPNACDAYVDSLARVALRQVAVRRRRMATGSP
jgi:glycosyltransferase involved in cell wall biosynthesis